MSDIFREVHGAMSDIRDRGFEPEKIVVTDDTYSELLKGSDVSMFHNPDPSNYRLFGLNVELDPFVEKSYAEGMNGEVFLRVEI